jgi:hypothetical protein
MLAESGGRTSTAPLYAATWEEAMNQVLKTEGPGIMIHALCPEGSGTELFPIDATPMRTSNLRG